MMIYIFVNILLLIIALRLEVVHSEHDAVISILGFSILKYCAVYFYLYVSSIYLTNLKFVAKPATQKFYYLIVGGAGLNFLSMNNAVNILSDPLLFALSIIFLIIIIFYGNRFFDRILNLMPFKEGELNKAFLTFPPKDYTDFLFFYVFIIIYLIFPEIVEMIWQGVVLK